MHVADHAVKSSQQDVDFAMLPPNPVLSSIDIEVHKTLLPQLPVVVLFGICMLYDTLLDTNC